MNITMFNQIIPFHTVLEHYHFDEIRESGNKLHACCKIHGGDSPTSFEVNTDKNLWYCHSGCKFGGNAIKLVQIMEGLDFFNAIIKLASICNIDISTLTFEKHIPTQYEDAVRFFESIASATPLTTFNAPSIYTTKVKQYREISEETCKAFNVRFTKSYPIAESNGELRGTRVHDKVVFDVVMNEKLVGQSLRSVQKDDTFRWLHMPSGFKRSKILFNYDKAVESILYTKDPTIIVCEGIMDVLRVYDAGYHNVVSPLGCNISPEQIRLLRGIATSIVLMLDNDVAGQLAVDKYVGLLKKQFDVYIVSYPTGKKDPGECSIEEIQYMIEKKVRML